MNTTLLYRFGFLAGKDWKPFSYLEDVIEEGPEYLTMLGMAQRGWLAGRTERAIIEPDILAVTSQAPTVIPWKMMDCRFRSLKPGFDLVDLLGQMAESNEKPPADWTPPK